MTEIRAIGRFNIHDGKSEEFKALVAQGLAIVREQDTGTRQYDWYFSADQSRCVLHETYASSAAVLEHIGHVGATLGALLAISDLTLEVFGDPSAELQEAVKGFAPQVFSFYQGL